MKCPKCGFDNPDGFRFCGDCTHPLTEKTEERTTGTVTESERKHVAVMFSDLSGYTAMTEKLDPEEVKEIMSGIFGEITQIIKKYDGFIERFIGDAIMAVFGIPKAHEDDSIRAVRAALEIHDAVEAFSPRYEKKVGRSLTMHTGINTGLVVTGEVDIEKGTHGLTGDAINLASRLEGIADAGEIIIGPDTYYQTRGWFEFETLESTRVKGKTDSVSIYRVVSVMDRPGPTAHLLQGVEARLVGRETEMAILTNALESLKQRQGSVISIVGHAGTGKSRLVREFKNRLEPDAVQWHEGHAYAYTQNIAYYPLTNLLTHAFQIREEDGPDTIREKVGTGVETLLWDRPEAKKYLGSLFSLRYEEVDKVSPEFWRSQLHKSVQQLLDAVASRGPTVVLIEDLHWADESFLELLRLLLKNTRRPVLFLCVYRPSFSLLPEGTLNAFSWPYEKIDLKELPWDETEAMLQSLLQSSKLPDELRYFIKQKVEGNPFYLEEVVNTLIDTKTLISDSGGWRLIKDLELADIPTTIQGLLTARLDRLERQAKRILQEASVIGRAFYYKVLTRITNLTTPVDDYLTGLESLDLIRAKSKKPDLEYMFKHALTQEVVYNGLLKRERQEIHERIGTAIEQLFQDRLPEFYETLAFHFERGQSVNKSVYYLIKSGEKNLNRYALKESHEYFENAYNIINSLTDRNDTENEMLIELLIKWALVFYYKGDFYGQVRLFLAHESTSNTIRNKEKAAMFFAWLGWGYYQSGISPTTNSSLQITASDKSLEYLIKARTIGEEIKSDKVIGYACMWLSWLYGESGNLQKGIELGNQAVKLAPNFPSDYYLYSKSLGGVAWNYLLMGYPDHCLKLGKELIRYGELHSQPRCLAMGYWSEGSGYYMAGDYDRAVESSRKSVEISIDPLYKGLSLTYLIACLAENNEMEAAGNKLAELGRLEHTLSHKGIETISDALHGIVMIGTGRMSLGMKKIMASQINFRNEKRESFVLMIEFMIGKIYFELSKREKKVSPVVLIKNIGFLVTQVPQAFKKAENRFRKVIALSEKIGAIGYVCTAHLYLGMLYMMKQKNELAQEHLEKSIPILKKIGAYGFLQLAEEKLALLDK